MELSLSARVLWTAGFCELVVLVLVLIVRRRWSTFPIFSAYISFQVIETTALYCIHRFGNPQAYFWSFWIGAIVDLGLQTAVVFELTGIVLKPTGTWVRDARKMFLLLALTGTVVAAAISYGVNPIVPNSFENWVEKGNLFAAMLNAQLFVAMGLASTRLGLAWRHHVMGIATGWAAWAVVGLFVEAAYSYFGANWHGAVLDNVRIVVYQIVTIYWTINLWLPEPETRTLSSEMQSYLIGLRQHVKLGAQGVSSIQRR
jgi:hypothetical protein